MFCVSLKRVLDKTPAAVLVAFCGFVLLATVSVSNAQRPKAGEEPLFSDFKGVRIGMTVDEARKKLGSPRDKSDEQDFYVFNDTQAVQVFYDKGKTVSAVSIDFMTGSSDIPAAKDVLGSEPDARPDGSVYKLVRYPKAGYWVSYSKTAGSSPTITITMQKIERAN
jgi:hypothetical protein